MPWSKLKKDVSRPKFDFYKFWVSTIMLIFEHNIVLTIHFVQFSLSFTERNQFEALKNA